MTMMMITVVLCMFSGVRVCLGIILV